MMVAVAQAEVLTPLEIELSLSSAQVSVDDELLASVKASGGTMPYRCEFEWSLHERDPETDNLISYPVAGQPLSEGKERLVPRFGEGGSVRVLVTDAQDMVESMTLSFTVEGAVANPLRLTGSLGQENIEDGQTQTVQANCMGGQGPYRYQFVWVAYTTDQMTHSEIPKEFARYTGESSRHEAIVPMAERATVFITAYDALGRSAMVSKGFMIYPSNAFDMQLSLSPQAATAGQPITVSANLTGNGEAYVLKYFWQVQEIDPVTQEPGSFVPVAQSELTNDTTHQAIIPFGQRGQVFVEATDGFATLSRSAVFEIKGALYKPLILGASLSDAHPKAGDRVQAKLEIAGGQPPYRSSISWYQWLIDPQTNQEQQHVFAQSAGENFTQDTQTIPEAPRGEVLVKVRDALGREAARWLEYRLQSGLTADANGDSELDMADVQAIIEHIVLGTSPTSFDNADANGSGVVDLEDLTWLLDQLIN